MLKGLDNNEMVRLYKQLAEISARGVESIKEVHILSSLKKYLLANKDNFMADEILSYSPKWKDHIGDDKHCYDLDEKPSSWLVSCKVNNAYQDDFVAMLMNLDNIEEDMAH